MARLSQEMSWKKALKLGNAHEKGNYKQFKKHQYEETIIPDSAASAMDIFNNKVGVAVGCNNKELSTDDLQELLRKKILAGELKMISKDSQLRSLDCNGNILNFNEYKGVWNIPRCIVSSKSHRIADLGR